MSFNGSIAGKRFFSHLFPKNYFENSFNWMYFNVSSQTEKTCSRIFRRRTVRSKKRKKKPNLRLFDLTENNIFFLRRTVPRKCHTANCPTEVSYGEKSAHGKNYSDQAYNRLKSLACLGFMWDELWAPLKALEISALRGGLKGAPLRREASLLAFFPVWGKL